MQIPNAISPVRWRPIGHGDQLSVVGHLDELRSRLIVALVAISVAFGICFWQNNELLHLINAPLAHQTQQQVRAGHGPLGATYTVQRSTLRRHATRHSRRHRRRSESPAGGHRGYRPGPAQLAA